MGYNYLGKVYVDTCEDCESAEFMEDNQYLWCEMKNCSVDRYDWAMDCNCFKYMNNDELMKQIDDYLKGIGEMEE